MAKQRYCVRNWKDYNKALVQRGSLTFWITEDALKQWRYQGQQQRGGKVIYSEVAIETCLIIREVFKLTYRACQGMTDSLLRLFSVYHLSAPHYTTLCRRSESLRIHLSRGSANSKHHCILIDSTGIQVYGESEWKRLKHKPSKQRLWRKFHLFFDADSQQILSGMMSENDKHDMNYFIPLLEQIENPVDQIIGDGSYNKRHCYRAAHERESKLLAPPQKNARLQAEDKTLPIETAVNPRDKAIAWIRKYSDPKIGLKEWKKMTNYHRRSLVETTMFRIKSLFGEIVRSKSFSAQQQQLLLRCKALNKMTTLGMPISEPI